MEDSMDGSVYKPKPRYVRCPRCRNILPEDINLLVYQCGVCNTMLQAKHWKGGGQTAIPLQSVSDNRSENEVSDVSSESITLSDNAACKTTDIGSTSNFDNGCPVTTENSESRANQNEITDENIDHLDKHMKENLSNEATRNSTDLGEAFKTHDEYHVSTVNSENEGNNAHGNQAFACMPCHIEKSPSSKISEKGGNEKKDGDEETNYLGEHMKRNLSDDDACDSIYVEKTSNSDDGYRVTRENSDEKEIMKAHRDEAINYVNKLMEGNLNLGRDDLSEVKVEVKNDQLMEPSCKMTLPMEDAIINEDLNNGTGSLLMSPDDSTSLANERSISSFGDRGDDLDGLQYRPSLKETFRVPDILETKSSTSQWMEEMPPSQESLLEMTLDREPSNKTCGSEEMASFHSDNFEQASRYGIYAPRRELSSVPDQLRTRKFENCQSGSQWISENNTKQSRMELLRKVDQLRYQILGSLDQRSGMYETPEVTSSRRARRSLRAPLFGIQELEADVLEHPFSALRSIRQQLPTGETNPYCSRCHALPPPGIFCNNGLCTSCYHMFHHHSSSTADFQYHRAASNPHLASSTSLSKVKDKTMKRHLIPILGGANFIVCYECLQLLQIPDDLQVSRYKINKVCCGVCSKVITFSFSNDFNLMGRRQNQISCYSEDSETPSTRSSIVSENHKDSSRETDRRKEATLHRLMGYCSASDIIYQPSDEDDDLY